MSKQFQDLSYAAQVFYILCATHKQTPLQSQALFNALREYYDLIGEGKSDYDIRVMAGQERKARTKSPYFVIPQKHLDEYGFGASYATKLKRELIQHGFIKVFANSKAHGAGNHQGANRDFSKRVTVYEFTNDWKKL